MVYYKAKLELLYQAYEKFIGRLKDSGCNYYRCTLNGDRLSAGTARNKGWLYGLDWVMPRETPAYLVYNSNYPNIPGYLDKNNNPGNLRYFMKGKNYAQRWFTNNAINGVYYCGLLCLADGEWYVSDSGVSYNTTTKVLSGNTKVYGTWYGMNYDHPNESTGFEFSKDNKNITLTSRSGTLLNWHNDLNTDLRNAGAGTYKCTVIEDKIKELTILLSTYNKYLSNIRS